VSRAARPAPRALAGVTLAALLLLALPVLLSVLALGTGGLAHEAGLQAAATHDTSLAALDRVDRFLQGDLTVTLAPAADAPAPPPVPPADRVGLALAERAPAGRVAAEAERRL
jgi:hypothetical protein